MLVLSRKRNEQIVIGDRVVVTVIDIRKTRVRLGIDAPKDVPVHREEIYEVVKNEQASVGPVENSKAASLCPKGEARAAGRDSPTAVAVQRRTAREVQRKDKAHGG